MNRICAECNGYLDGFCMYKAKEVAHFQGAEKCGSFEKKPSELERKAKEIAQIANKLAQNTNELAQETKPIEQVMETKTRICKRCGRELPDEAFKTPTAKTCNDCCYEIAFEKAKKMREKKALMEKDTPKEVKPKENPLTTSVKARTFAKIAEDMVSLHERKNADYGNAFGKSFEEFGLVASAIRLTDKLSRFKQLCRQPAQVKDESIKDTLIDMAAYAIMTIEEMERQES